MYLVQGRGGRGSIFIWAAGNGGQYYDSCTADGYASSIYTIAVGSADQKGEQADYDEFCSSKMAVTFTYDSWTFPSGDDKWTAYNQVVSGYSGQSTRMVFYTMYNVHVHGVFVLGAIEVYLLHVCVLSPPHSDWVGHIRLWLESVLELITRLMLAVSTKYMMSV